MTTVVNVAEAKARLSDLLRRAAAGEDIVIARAGKPLARLGPVDSQEPRPFGIAKHWKVDPDLFLEPTDPEEIDAAEGKYTDEFGISR